MKESLKKQAIVSSAIMILLIAININWAVTNDISIGRAIVLSVCNWLCLISYLLLAQYPLMAVGAQFTNQLLLIFSDWLGGADVTEAINNTGAIELFCMLSVAIFALHFHKNNKKNIKGYNKKKLREKVKLVITYKRRPIEIPIWAMFCIWCIIIALILGTSNDSAFEVFKLKIEYKLFAAATLVMPTMVTLAINTTSNITYSLLIVQQVLKFITMYDMAVRRELEFSNFSFVLLETLVIAIATIEYMEGRPKKEKKQKVEDDKPKEFVSTLGIDYSDEEIENTFGKK